MGKIHLRFLLSFTTILSIVASCKQMEMIDKPKDAFEILAPGYDLMVFMAEIENKDMDEVSDSLDAYSGESTPPFRSKVHQ